MTVLDEISECNPKEVGMIVYSLSNGTGKQRAGRTGAAKQVTRWRCLIVSSGERSVANHMLEGGYTAKAGQLVRMLDIPANRKYGAWDCLHEFDNGQQFSDAIKSAASKDHGLAGPAFLKKLVSYEGAPTLLDLFKQDMMPDNAESQERRAVSRFALIALAGELATQYGLTGWGEGEAIDAATECFNLWRQYRGTGNSEARKILAQLNDFIDRHGDSRFSSRQDEKAKIINRAGWWDNSGASRVYLFTSGSIREALQGFEFKSALYVLENAGVIKTSTNGERATQIKICGVNKKLYRINVASLELEL